MLLFLDTETNGLPKNWRAPVTDLDNWPRLIQLAYILYDAEGNELGQFDRIVRPDGFSISPESSAIHGITQARALESGLPLAQVMEEFARHLDNSQTIVAHNMSFDEKILDAELLRLGLDTQLASKSQICTMKSTSDFCQIEGKYGYKWPTLPELHQKLFGEDFANAHNALADIAATARCFWALRDQAIL